MFSRECFERCYKYLSVTFVLKCVDMSFNMLMYCKQLPNMSYNITVI